ncbi:MAG: universal stress protein, partial [Mycobacteriaceae bacterium]
MTVNPRIVVGVDGSPSSTCAVRWAAETAARHNAPLLLLSAWAIPGGYGSIGMPPSLLEDQETHCRRQLAEATRVAHEAAPDAGLSVTSELATSPAVGTLLERSRDARIVVVGSRRLGELTAGLLGSVTSALAHHAHSPIAVIREWPRPADP